MKKNIKHITITLLIILLTIFSIAIYNIAFATEEKLEISNEKENSNLVGAISWDTEATYKHKGSNEIGSTAQDIDTPKTITPVEKRSSEYR